MRGRGCAPLMVAALSCQKSTQKSKLPSFFLTITTAEARGLLDGRITPLVSICWTWAISSCRTAGFDDDRAGGGAVLWFQWCVAAMGCSQDLPLLG